MAGTDDRDRYILFLPEDDGQVDTPDDKGMWQPINELMTKLSKGIKVPPDATADALTSIPTVWARPVLFAQALSDANHPLHSEVLAEWRGLLGIFCFRERYGWKIRWEPYPIKRDSDEIFERTLADLSFDDDWLSMNLLYFGDKLIAGTCPMSLFFTPAEYDCRKLDIPWKNTTTGRLTDPTEYFKDAQYKKELHVLREWIKNSAERIGGYAFKDGEVKDRLIGLLNAWRKEIPETDYSDEVEFGDPIVSVPPYSLASCLCRYEEVKWSDFFLDCKVPVADNPPIVIVKHLWAEEKVLYQPHKTTDVAFANIEKLGPVIEGEMSEVCEFITYKGRFLRPENLFTDKLLRTPLYKKGIVVYDPAQKDCVLPLKKEILKFFDATELAGLVSWEEVDNGVKVTLKIPLVPKDRGTKDSFTKVSKLYKNPEDIVRQDLAPVLEIWPDFRAADWKHHYSLLEAEGIQFSCKPYPEPDSETMHGRTILWRNTQFPKAIICVDKKDKNKIMGLVPLRSPTILTKPQLASRWKVSVDFGTSNTTVCYRVSDKIRPSRLEFKDRCLQVTDSDVLTRHSILFSCFTPPVEIDGMFPSHLMAFQHSANPYPMVDGIVFFVEPLQWMSIMGSEGNKVRENLKWSVSPEERAHIGTFLRQVLLMICAEARIQNITEIDLRYSFPSSFSRKMVDDLRGFWIAIKTTAREAGIQLYLAEPETESICVAKFLVEDEAAVPPAAKRPQIMVDMGGGTTDVAIWMENRLQIQTSLLLAGNAIAKLARKNAGFRAKLQELVADQNIIIDDAMFADHSMAVMNVLLHLYGADIVRGVHITDKHTEEIRQARTTIYLAAAANFYYIGMLLRYLASKGKRVLGCDVFLAGNGTRLLPWTLTDNYMPLLRVLEKGAGSDISLEKPRISPANFPKEEVARGLLFDEFRAEGVEDPEMILGEKGYTIDGEVLPPTFDVRNNIDRLRRLTPPEHFEELDAFVKIFNSQADDLYLDKIEVVPSIVASLIDATIAGYRTSAVEEILPQPMFIEEANALLTCLLQQPIQK